MLSRIFGMAIAPALLAAAIAAGVVGSGSTELAMAGASFPHETQPLVDADHAIDARPLAVATAR